MFLLERFPPIRHILRLHILALQIFEQLTAIQMQIQVLFIRRHLHTSGIGINNMRIFRPVFKIIDQHIV